MFGSLFKIFSGSALNSIENIAKEWIETDTEKAEAGKIDAEAKSLFIKTLDPNGLMRRELSRFASKMYGVYLITTLSLLIVVYFGYGDSNAAQLVTDKITKLFMPITTAWGAIVSASFGVNAANTIKGIK